MANLASFDPLTHRMSKLLQNLLWRPTSLFEDDDDVELKLDIFEKGNCYIVRADLPGVRKEDIQVDIDGCQVSIAAEMKREKQEKTGESAIYCERYQGRVFRSLTLDCPVDQNAAQARYIDGVLELTLPKKGDLTQKRLTIS
jgi:HSP20 family protein